MQIEATSRGEWVLEPDFTEPSREEQALAHGRDGALALRHRVVVALGGALLVLAVASLTTLLFMLPRLYTPFF